MVTATFLGPIKLIAKCELFIFRLFFMRRSFSCFIHFNKSQKNIWLVCSKFELVETFGIIIIFSFNFICPIKFCCISYGEIFRQKTRLPPIYSNFYRENPKMLFYGTYEMRKGHIKKKWALSFWVGKSVKEQTPGTRVVNNLQKSGPGSCLHASNPKDDTLRH